MLGLKQEALADQLGGDWTQKKISMLEAKDVIEQSLLEELALALKVPTEAIKNFNEEAAINIISSTLSDTSIANINQNPVFNFNPIEKVLQLNDEKMKLYEALLREKDDKIALLQKLLDNQ